MSKEITEVENKNTAIAIKLNSVVGSVLTQENLTGFERAYAIAESIGKLQELLTPEYMAPIMKLQGNKLGFKTDKDKTGGYPMDVVKNCLIEAVLIGVQPYGNQFNIIAGNCYLTKEGCGYSLNNFRGLSYKLICSLPRINADKTSASVEATIKWTINGKEEAEIIPIPIKMDAYTSVDAVIGKATRKGRAWLLSTVSGIEIPEGDITDITYVDMTGKEDLKIVQKSGQAKIDLP